MPAAVAVQRGEVTPLEHTVIGALAGLLEVTIMQPTVGIKNALQEGRLIPRNPVELYRGYAVNAAAMLPITATQFGTNRLFEKTYREATGQQPGDFGKVGIAMAAGSCSAVFGCSAEYVMIQQQKSGRPLSAELRHVVTVYGPMAVFKGFSATVMRESLYAAGYLGVMPVLRRHLDQAPGIKEMPGAPLLVSGVAAGLLATVTTQPADTVKTRMQAFTDVTAYPQYATMSSTVRHIVQTEGVGTLFAGLVPRALRIVCAVFILTGTRNTLVGSLEKSRGLD